MKNINWKWLLFSFKGRINRAKWWLGVVVLVITSWLVSLGVSFLMPSPMIAEMRAATEKCQSIPDNNAKDDCIMQNVPQLAEIEAEGAKCNQMTDFNAKELCTRQVASQSLKITWSYMSKTFPFILPFYIIYMWIGLAVGAKRLHDRNVSGWWQLVPVLPSLTALAWPWIFMMRGLGPHAFIMILVSLIAGISGLIIFIICGFLKGTNGLNKYGTDPLLRD